MNGSIRWKEGSWRLTYQADGRRHFRTIRAPNNRRGQQEAGRALAALITEVDRGRHRGDPNTTFADLVDEWFTTVGPHREAGTRDAYRQDLARALPHIGDIRLVKLRTIHLDRLYAHLEQTYQPKTVRNTHGTISSLLGSAVRWGWIDENPAADADPPDWHPDEINVPTVDQVEALIAAARPDFAVYLRLAATAGHRRGSLLGLRWTDVDLDQRTLTFARAIATAEGDLHVKGTKANRTDTITLGAKVAEVLREHRTTCIETALAIPDLAYPDDAYLFSQDPAGARPWHPGGVAQRWRPTCRRAKVQDVRPHDLKHFAVTRLLAGGIPPWVVANRCGTSLNTILKVYAHWIPGSDGGAADLMDELLG